MGGRKARAWRPTLRNNIGQTLRDAGREEEALVEFQQALALFEQTPNVRPIRIARWHVARSLRALNVALEHDTSAGCR